MLRRMIILIAAKRRAHACAAAALVMALAVGGCMIHRPPDAAAPPVDTPPAFSQSGQALMPAQWWTSFADPSLDAIEQAALGGNLTLKAAFERVEQARALAKQSGADLWPSVQAGASAERSRQLFPGLGPMPDTELTVESYGLNAGVSYELDLWGRLRSRARAGSLEYAAAREDLDALGLSLSATVAEVCYSLSEQRALMRLTESQIDNSRKVLDLVEMRFTRGQVTLLDVQQQREQWASLRAQAPLVQAGVETLEHQLAVLTGRPPQTPIAVPERLPGLPPPPATGLPADLLQRRPDVKAAHARVMAADYRTGAAIADRLPALRLTAQAGFGSLKSFPDAFNNWLYDLAANLTAPVFQGGRLKAEVARSRARTRELTLAYGQTVLDAFREVEDALSREQRQHEHIAALDESLTAARAALDQARARYEGGQADYLSVLAALQSAQRAERDRLRAERDLVLYRIGLYRALGGSWRADRQEDVP